MQKKLITMLAVVVLVLGVLAGCSGNNKTPSNPNTGNSGQGADEDIDYRNGFPERVTLEIPVYDRAFEGWNVADNYYTRWIQKEFGDKYNVDVKFTPIGRSTEVQDFQQLLASRKAPDIIFHYDMPQAMNYYSSEVMQPLDTEEIAHYAPTYWNNMKDTIERYGQIDGQQIFFFAERPNVSNWVNIIRKDWVEAVGMKVEDLTSLEKFNEMLVKWRDAGLGKAGGSLTRNVFNYSYPFRDWPVDPETHALYTDLSVADFTTEATEKWLRNLNYQYNNKLIDQEFYLRDDANKIKAEFVAGRTGTYGEYIASNTDVFEAVKKNNPEAEFAVIPPLAGVPEGGVPQGRADWPFGLIMGINHESSDLERIAVWLYLEWMSQPENLFALQNGFEGMNYTGLDENGLPIKNVDYDGEAKLSPNNNKDYWALVVESPVYGTEEETIQALKSFWSPPGYEYIVEDMLTYREQQLPYLYPDPLFTVPIESVSKYKADLNNLFQELYLDIVMSPADQFDAKYEAAKKKFLDAGYQKILDEKKAAYEAGNIIE
jgi:ABC-type glycerol-3-phosphate transport system substrate-binding protein